MLVTHVGGSTDSHPSPHLASRVAEVRCREASRTPATDWTARPFGSSFVPSDLTSASSLCQYVNYIDFFIWRQCGSGDDGGEPGLPLPALTLGRTAITTSRSRFEPEIRLDRAACHQSGVDEVVGLRLLLRLRRPVPVSAPATRQPPTELIRTYVQEHREVDPGAGAAPALVVEQQVVPLGDYDTVMRLDDGRGGPREPEVPIEHGNRDRLAGGRGEPLEHRFEALGVEGKGRSLSEPMPPGVQDPVVVVETWKRTQAATRRSARHGTLGQGDLSRRLPGAGHDGDRVGHGEVLRADHRVAPAQPVDVNPVRYLEDVGHVVGDQRDGMPRPRRPGSAPERTGSVHRIGGASRYGPSRPSST